MLPTQSPCASASTAILAWVHFFRHNGDLRADYDGIVLYNRIQMQPILCYRAAFLTVDLYTKLEHVDRRFVRGAKSAEDIHYLHMSVPGPAAVECGGIADTQNTPSLDGPRSSSRWKEQK